MSFKIINNCLEKDFQFQNFSQALNFVNKIWVIAEEMNHHPDIQIYSYKNVRITLTTHDAWSSITDKDYKLAEEIQRIYTNFIK